MSPILGIWASAQTAANSTSYESIATSTVGSGGSAYVEFTSIPSTYTHLQIRYIAQTNRGTFPLDNFQIRMGNGSIDTGSNYSWHHLGGDGASAYPGAASSVTFMSSNSAVSTSVISNTFGAGVFDLLDYANTSKYKTARLLEGHDVNGTTAGFGGRVGISSGLWQSTSAVNTIRFTPAFGSLITQYSQFALYGIKG